MCEDTELKRCKNVGTQSLKLKTTEYLWRDADILVL